MKELGKWLVAFAICGLLAGVPIAFSAYPGKLTSGHLFFGDANNFPADKACSGDVTCANTGAITVANAAISNAKLANSSTTVNGTTCTLGSTCTVTASATGITVGTTTITSGTNGRVLYDNSGVLGETADVAFLSVADQVIAGGANVTTRSLSTGNVTIDCGSRPLQSITNGGAFTITAPANDGDCILKVTNNASAGAITFSGFSVGATTGDALTTTNGQKFFIWIGRIGGDSTYRVGALQ